MKVYIAGKITGYDNYEKDFEEAAEKLKAAGYEPVIPYKANDDFRREGRTYKEYIDHGLKVLSGCDAVYFLNNFTTSKGARLEWVYADTVQLPIVKDII